MIIRAVSRRSPYHRGGLKFDVLAGRTADGRALVEIDQITLDRIGLSGLRELEIDPNIELDPPHLGLGQLEGASSSRVGAASEPGQVKTARVRKPPVGKPRTAARKKARP